MKSLKTIGIDGTKPGRRRSSGSATTRGSSRSSVAAAADGCPCRPPRKPVGLGRAWSEADGLSLGGAVEAGGGEAEMATVSRRAAGYSPGGWPDGGWHANGLGLPGARRALGAVTTARSMPVRFSADHGIVSTADQSDPEQSVSASRSRAIDTNRDDPVPCVNRQVVLGQGYA